MNFNSIIQNIHSKYPIVDAHLDLAFDLVKKRQYGKRKIMESDYLTSWKKGGVNLIVSSIFIENQYIPEMALRMALGQVSALISDIKESSDYFELCTSYNEIQKTFEKGKIAILISLEDTMPLYNDMKLLPIFYELGVRIVGLSWSRRNFACEGAHFKPVKEGRSGGLTEFGVNLVEESEKMGMLIDISHINDEGFWDVMEVSNKPIIASHSNVRKLVNTKRNLSDDQIKAIAKKNGVIGMNAMNFIVCEEECDENVQKLCDHIEYIINLVGPEYVGLGFDFNDQILKYIPQDELDLLPRKCKDVLNGHGEIPLITEELLRRKYSEEVIAKILGGNFIRVFKDTL